MRKPGSSGEKTRRNIRAAAVRLLAERGYSGMSLRALASSIGVEASALYNYVDSKQQLLFLLVSGAMEKLLEDIQEIGAIEDAPSAMQAFVRSHLNSFLSKHNEYLVLLTENRSLSAENLRTIRRMQRLYQDDVRAIIERGVATGQFRVVNATVMAIAIIQLLGSVIFWYKPQGSLGPDDLIEIYTDLVLSMLHAESEVPARHGRAAGDNRRGTVGRLARVH